MPVRHALHPADAPTLAVVVASGGDAGTLRSLLGELLPPCTAHGVEVVVARGGDALEAAALARELPGVRWVRPADDAPGSLRVAGMAAAEGEIVLLAADDDPGVPARLAHLLRVYGVEEPAASPPVPERAERGLVERAG